MSGHARMLPELQLKWLQLEEWATASYTRGAARTAAAVQQCSSSGYVRGAGVGQHVTPVVVPQGGAVGLQQATAGALVGPSSQAAASAAATTAGGGGGGDPVCRDHLISPQAGAATDLGWEIPFRMPLIPRGVAVGPSRDAAEVALQSLPSRMQLIVHQPAVIARAQMKWLKFYNAAPQLAVPPAVPLPQAAGAAAASAAAAAGQYGSGVVALDCRMLCGTPAGPATVPVTDTAAAAADRQTGVGGQLVGSLKPILQEWMHRRDHSAAGVVSAVRYTLRALTVVEPDTCTVDDVLNIIANTPQPTFSAAVSSYNTALRLRTFVRFCKAQGAGAMAAEEKVAAAVGHWRPQKQKALGKARKRQRGLAL